MGVGNGNGNGHTEAVTEEKHMADEDTQRDQSWRSGDFRDPVTVKLGLIEICSYAEESTRQGRLNKGELEKLRTSVNVQARLQAQLLTIVSRADRRTELNTAMLETLQHDVRGSEPRLRAAEIELAAVRARNERHEAHDAERDRKLAEGFASIKDSQSRLVTTETALVVEAFRAQLTSQAEVARESRTDAREEGRSRREEKSKLKWWLLALVAGLISTASAGLLGRYAGHTVEPQKTDAPHH